MKSSHGWIQGYNAQVMVEEASGVIEAQEVTAHSGDSTRLRPMLDRLEENLARVGVPEEERRPTWFTADAGYCSENNLRDAGGTADRCLRGDRARATPPGWNRSWKPDQDTVAGRHAG